jgi:hypothetical protein
MVQARVISETTMTPFPSKIFYRTPCERARETTIEAQQQQEKLEPFNPTVQEQDQHTQKSVTWLWDSAKHKSETYNRSAKETRVAQALVGFWPTLFGLEE